ncbi:hypothetical protein AB0F88_39810 [Streptosporangium sp. NPDC023963]|uniref:hypothetical protein n=1 Tax=Streptosporangium sp. NPDC023963 TaxID=3155608 RepID=UPI0034339C58
MAEHSALDDLTVSLRAEFGPPVEEKIALTVAPEDMSARQLFRSVEILRTALVEARQDAHTARIDYELARTRADNAEAKLRAVANVRAWVDETDRRFVYVSDLATALGPPSPTTQEGEQ